MDWWVAALWGLLGGGLVETLDFYTELRARGAFPWNKPRSMKRDRRRPPAAIYAVGTALRLIMAAGVTAAAGASGLIDRPWLAVAAGVAAPLILQRLAAQVPFAIQQATESDAGSEPPATTRPEAELGGGGSVTGVASRQGAGQTPGAVEGRGMSTAEPSSDNSLGGVGDEHVEAEHKGE